MEEVDRTVHHMQDVASNDPDPADRATQEEEFSLELRTRDRERKLIKKIDAPSTYSILMSMATVKAAVLRSVSRDSRRDLPLPSALTAKRWTKSKNVRSSAKKLSRLEPT